MVKFEKSLEIALEKLEHAIYDLNFQKMYPKESRLEKTVRILREIFNELKLVQIELKNKN